MENSLKASDAKLLCTLTTVYIPLFFPWYEPQVLYEPHHLSSRNSDWSGLGWDPGRVCQMRQTILNFSGNLLEIQIFGIIVFMLGFYVLNKYCRWFLLSEKFRKQWLEEYK